MTTTSTPSTPRRAPTSAAAGRPETARWLQAGDQTVLSVITRPTGPARGAGVIFLNGGHGGSSAGKNRIYSRMAADLAERGFHSIRLEWHGIGDSTGAIDEFVLHQPFRSETLAAAAALREEGVRDIALYGECIGARTAVVVADELPDLRAAFLVTLLLRDGAISDQTPQRTMAEVTAGQIASRWTKVGYLFTDPVRRELYLRWGRNLARQKWQQTRRALTGDKLPPWVSFQVVRALEGIGRRGIRAKIVYGTSEFDEHQVDFEAIQADLRPLRHPSLEYEFLDEMIAGYRTLAVQERLVAMVGQWFDDAVPARS